MTIEQDEHAAPVEAWDAIASTYDEFVAPGEAALASQALALAGLQPGDRFLDVAAGPGGLSLPAARFGATVLATDWSPAMVERFEARVRIEGISNAAGRVMDARRLDLPDDTFDVVGSLFGVMLVADQSRALREMARVANPGGRVLLVAYGSPSEFEALQCFIGALRAVLPDFDGLPDDPPPLEFQVSDPEILHRRLADAGLRDITVDTAHHEHIEVGSGEDLWAWCLGSNPIPGMLTANLDEEHRTTMRQILDGMVRERAGGTRVATLTAPVNIGLGTK